MLDSAPSVPPILGADEPPPVTVYNADAMTPLLLVCDHASNRIPARLGDLGVPPSCRERHIAYDIGAADVVIGLAERLDCRAVLAGYSRLVVDLNRAPGDPSSIPAISPMLRVSMTLGRPFIEWTASAQYPSSSAARSNRPSSR